MSYARDTGVSVDRTKADIEALLTRAGASRFGYSTTTAQAEIIFTLRERLIRYRLILPKRTDPEVVFTKGRRWRRTDAEAEKAWQQACRARWRALLLIVRAKIEAVEAGIATFEEEFMSYTVLPDNRTVGEHVEPAIVEAYATGRLPEKRALLEAPVVEAET